MGIQTNTTLLTFTKKQSTYNQYCEISLKMDTLTPTTLDSKLNLSLFLCALFCALRQVTIVEKLQYEILPTSMGTLYSFHTER